MSGTNGQLQAFFCMTAVQACQHEDFELLIQLHGISVTLGGHPILDQLSWTIKDGRRIGLIGANGAGKTTLLRMLSGHLEADDGSISSSSTTGYLAQDVQEHASERSVIDEALAAFSELQTLQEKERTLARELEKHAEPPEAILHALERVHAELSLQEAHLIRPRTEAVLHGLGFDSSDFERPLSTLSGGYRMRTVLAQILLRKPDVLLLDEPTNHLDIVSIDWLETYLKSYPGTVIVVSHDRYFLNRMVTSIAHLSRGRITEYAGNYDYFLAERAKRRVLEQAAYDNQQREIVQTQRFIERFRYKATKARQVQSRIKHLERMPRLLPPESEEAHIRIRFPVSRRPGKVVMNVSPFSKAYPSPSGNPLFVFDAAGPLQIMRGNKIALIGKNGAGKSTLARILNGTEAFDGTRKVGHNVDAGFFAQHQAEFLSRHHAVLESLQEVAGQQGEGTLRTLLGAFLFTGDDVFKRVQALSGGEKSRLALARTLVEGTNFLILDEPTNHLDIQSIQVLIEALRQYEGTFVVVSHDRHFLDQVANTIWHVGAGRVRIYHGTYSEYQWHLKHGYSTEKGVRERPNVPAGPVAAKPRKRSGGPKTKEQKRLEAELRNQAYRKTSLQEAGTNALTREAQIARTEHSINRLEKQSAEVEALLSAEEVYTDPSRTAEASIEYAEVQAQLKTLYAQWEQLVDKA